MRVLFILISFFLVGCKQDNPIYLECSVLVNQHMKGDVVKKQYVLVDKYNNLFAWRASMTAVPVVFELFEDDDDYGIYYYVGEGVDKEKMSERRLNRRSLVFKSVFLDYDCKIDEQQQFSNFRGWAIEIYKEKTEKKI